jgi:hypothetical protein
MALEASADLSIFARLAPGNLHLVNWERQSPSPGAVLLTDSCSAGNSFPIQEG